MKKDGSKKTSKFVTVETLSPEIQDNRKISEGIKGMKEEKMKGEEKKIMSGGLGSGKTTEAKYNEARRKLIREMMESGKFGNVACCWQFAKEYARYAKKVFNNDCKEIGSIPASERDFLSMVKKIEHSLLVEVEIFCDTNKEKSPFKDPEEIKRTNLAYIVPIRRRRKV